MQSPVRLRRSRHGRAQLQRQRRHRDHQRRYVREKKGFQTFNVTLTQHTVPEQMHPDGGWGGSAESRDFSPATTSPKSRSCWLTVEGSGACWPSEDGTAPTGRERSTDRPFHHYCLTVNECNAQLYQQTVRHERGSVPKMKTLRLPGLSSAVPLSTEQNYLLYL